MPFDEVLPVAKQIAEALEAAHERGIVHRDLKPANIKLRPDGTVKVLDFGLAKAMEPVAAMSPALSQSPTMTTPAMTELGMILGTAAYMSPEQARGKPVDKRADVWAFGCVLYEMLTGTPAFPGDDVAETIGAVIHTQPKFERLPEDTPSRVRTLLQRCLDKDARNRLRDIGEARIALENARQANEAVPALRSPSAIGWLPWSIAVAATIGALLTVFWERPPAPNSVTRFSFTAPDNTTFPIPAAMMALSPNGRTLAFVAVDALGQRKLWYQNLESARALALSGTEGANEPFWSADSRSIAYFTDSALWTVDITSGRLLTLWNGIGTGGTWRDDGLIVFSTADGLSSIRTPGGEATVVIDGRSAPGQSAWHSPKFLPDGEHLLYVARSEDAPGYQAYLTTLRGDPPGHLMPVQSKVEYVDPGWIFYVANAQLVAQRFDAETLAAAGEPVALAADLPGNALNGRKAFTVSGAGVLAFRERPLDTTLEVRDRAGRLIGQVGRTGDVSPVSLAPDGNRLLFRRNNDVWSADLTTGLETRITFDAPGLATPVWSPDAKWIAFRSGNRLIRVAADGSGQVEDLGAESDGGLTQWTAVGVLSDPGGGVQLTRIGQLQPESLPGLPSNAREGQISPDGQWIAYAYAERGDFQIYVQAVAGGGRWQVSRSGGRQPRWRGDGRELYYIAADGNLTAAQIQFENGFTVRHTQALFDIGATTGLPSSIGFYYDVTSNGERFFLSTDFSQQIRTPIGFVLNWQEEVNRLTDN